MMNLDNSLVHDDFFTKSYDENQLKHFMDGNSYDLMENWAYQLTAGVLFCIGFFGFFLNLFVIILMCKDIKVRLIDIGPVIPKPF
jgi:hypothetical protein